MKFTLRELFACVLGGVIVAILFNVFWRPVEIAGYLDPHVYYIETPVDGVVCWEVHAGNPKTGELIKMPCSEFSEEEVEELAINAPWYPHRSIVE